MLQKSLIYITLWFLLQLSAEINCQTIHFKPIQRIAHTATFIDNKLYISGGVIPSNINSYINEFLYLDVSSPFNTKELLWQDLSNNTIIPPHRASTTVVGGTNNNTLFLYGGQTNDNTSELVYTFDPQNKKWSIPITTADTGTSPVRKRSLTGVISNNGKMYLWGGYTLTADGINGTDSNDMLILDTVNLSWGKGSSTGVPSPRSHYGSVLLPNQNIIYIGKNVTITFIKVTILFIHLPFKMIRRL